MKKLLSILCIALLSGCGTLNQTIITVTEVRKEVMNDLGQALRDGRLTAATWMKIVEYDNQYRAAARTARIALERYRDFGEGDPAASFLAVKDAVFQLITILGNYQDVTVERNQLTNATKL